MFPRLLACLLLALAAGAGCCCDPLLKGGRFHEGGAGPIAGSCATGSCATGGCGAPRGALVAPFALGNLFCCTDGCGEWYLDEWLSDPPKGCDPCDDCGNYVGYRHGHHLGGLLHKLWGYRYTPSGVSPYGNYHGYAEATHGGHYPERHYEGYVESDGQAEHFVESEMPAEIARSPQVDSSYYDIEPGETLVPGSVRITEGGVTGEPTPATLTSPSKASASPHVLPGPAAARPRSKAPAARQAIHRQTSYSTERRSPRHRPQPE